MTDNQRKSFSDIVSNKKREEDLQSQKGKSENANSKLMTFKLPKARWMALKLRALEENRHMCDIIIEAIEKDYRSKGLNW